ncbi:hypothetical protein ACOME3_009422 [Neoechinorhynchus agilis]
MQLYDFSRTYQTESAKNCEEFCNLNEPKDDLTVPMPNANHASDIPINSGLNESYENINSTFTLRPLTSNTASCVDGMSSPDGHTVSWNDTVKFTPLRIDSYPDIQAADIHSVRHSSDGDISASVEENTESDQSIATCDSQHFVVVAIDFGTTFSGYAFALTKDPTSIHMMRKWEGGDPGVVNQKTPTTILLTPNGQFHSFGFYARDYYHDLDPQESRHWLYFEKFKMHLHHTQELDSNTLLTASNGKQILAMQIFTYALVYFKDHALRELSEQAGVNIVSSDVKWVITVPAIWRQPAKAFMREAAYKSGMLSVSNPDQLVIALEPEAASIYIRKLKLHNLFSANFHSNQNRSVTEAIAPNTKSKYMVVDCGGGTVDITVHELNPVTETLKELYKATGGPYGSTAVDNEFEVLLNSIFTYDFMETFKTRRPAGFVDLMVAFEARKRVANSFKSNHLNISLPFSFIDLHKRIKGISVESAIKKYNNLNYKWSSQGMLRLTSEAMNALFQPVLEKICTAISEVLHGNEVKEVEHMFLVGGFAESPILQQYIRSRFSQYTNIIIPQDVSLAILKGAVLFGIDPTIVNVRRSRLTYGVGILNKFIKGKHPNSKLLLKNNTEWCADIFDKFVVVDQSVGLGDVVSRRYAPLNTDQSCTAINFYCAESDRPTYITDIGVKKIGTLVLEQPSFYQDSKRHREIQTRMIFGDTEIKVSATDVHSGRCVRATIDFLNK